MRVIGSIATNVFRESVRDKVLYNLVFFAVLLISASYLISQLTAGQDLKIIKDLGLAATSVFGLFIAVFIGIGLVSKEVERKSIYSLLTKPLRRHDFILGKFLGLALTLVINLGVMTLALYAVLAYMSATADASVKAAWEAPALDPNLLKALILILAELVLITAVALFFSSFSSPMLSASLTFGLWVAGHFNADLKHFENVVSSRTAAWIARGVYYLIPNFSAFDIKALVVHGQPVPFGYIAFTLAYAVLYISMLIIATMVIFSRRDFR